MGYEYRMQQAELPSQGTQNHKLQKEGSNQLCKKMIIYEPISIQYTREEWKLMMGF